MECPKCRHKVLETSSNCLYCGARTGPAVTPAGTPDSPGDAALPEISANPLSGFRAKAMEYESEGLEGLPPLARKRAEAMLKNGGGETQVLDFKTISPNKEAKYRLEDLPESLREKVEDILRKGSEDHRRGSIRKTPDFSLPAAGKKKKMNFFSALKFLLKGAFIS